LAGVTAFAAGRPRPVEFAATAVLRNMESSRT
jgi:hypothetical protein